MVLSLLKKEKEIPVGGTEAVIVEEEVGETREGKRVTH